MTNHHPNPPINPNPNPSEIDDSQRPTDAVAKATAPVSPSPASNIVVKNVPVADLICDSTTQVRAAERKAAGGRRCIDLDSLSDEALYAGAAEALCQRLTPRWLHRCGIDVFGAPRWAALTRRKATSPQVALLRAAIRRRITGETEPKRIEDWGVAWARSGYASEFFGILYRHPCQTVRGRHYLARVTPLSDEERAGLAAERPEWERVRRMP